MLLHQLPYLNMDHSRDDKLRPNTVKYADFRAMKQGQRPFSASKTALLRRLKDSRSRPSKLPYAPEELYSRNLELKGHVNHLQNQNLRLNTKIKLLEKDGRKEEQPDNK